ncbi:hypothetical protein J2X48_000690 [Bosea sp. BE271]|uniref:hypothetical protein n=1 Tax=Bosea TaxID=85413 RepID=UPI002864EDE0|nr:MULTISPECIES: hypothetical protein [Bosea]MDR6826506.1 hypothetical protein [Bosea robiniae]MDR6893216.1 hypothetical protein [Bosea sp. BE109]MDR7137085.1 hypothetical protein [Bosea sp. BE168]MDR7173784.1 hypothetical protein [Bosea sp. BE271]
MTDPTPQTTPTRDEAVRYEYRMRPTWSDEQPWSPWSECTQGHAEAVAAKPIIGDWESEARALYAIALPAPKGDSHED